MTARAKPIGAPYCFSLPGEEWREIAGVPGYWASSFGRIASGPRRTSLGRVLKQHPGGPDKRPRVSLGSKGGVSRKRFVHRLVCEAFHGPAPSVKHEVAHGDGNRWNNLESNLRWATHVENMQDAVQHGTLLGGERYSDGDVRAIRALKDSNVRSAEIAKQFGTTREYVDQIARAARRAAVR